MARGELSNDKIHCPSVSQISNVQFSMINIQ